VFFRTEVKTMEQKKEAQKKGVKSSAPAKEQKKK
jgi:hypothetical protein